MAFRTGRLGKWVALTLGAGSLLVAWARLSAPVPPPSDLPGFALGGLGVALTLAAALLWQAERAARHDGAKARRMRRPLYLAAGGYLGLVLGVLVLAYKDNSVQEWEALWGWNGAVDALLHAVTAPLTSILGFFVGFLDRRAPLYLATCIGAGLLFGYVVYRRQWPREREQAEPAAATG